MDGFGKGVPLEKRHVIVYFVQKGLHENDALEFFKYYNERNWKGIRNRPLLNWKMAAWRWIMKLIIADESIISGSET